MVDARTIMLALLVLLASLLPVTVSIAHCRCEFPKQLIGSLSWNRTDEGLTANGTFWVDFEEGNFRAMYETSGSNLTHQVFVNLNSSTWFYTNEEGCHIGEANQFHLPRECAAFETAFNFGCTPNGNQVFSSGSVEMDGYSSYEILLGCNGCFPERTVFRDSFGPNLGSIITEYSQFQTVEKREMRRFFPRRIRCPRN